MRVWSRGDESLLDNEVTVIAGEQRSSRYGKEVAVNYALELSGKGHTIALVLGAGVTLAVARALIEEGIDYIVMSTSGLDNPLPPHMAAEGAAAALLMAPEPSGPSTERRRKLAWDCLIERCDQVILVDGRPGDFAEQFACRAIEAGVPLYAVPGPVDEVTSTGPNRLIATGDAQAITNPNMLARGEGSRSRRRSLS